MGKEPNATSDKILPQCVLQVGVLLLATVLLVFCSLPLMILGEKISHVKLDTYNSCWQRQESNVS